MPLQIRDERASRLARELANRLHTTMTEAVVRALENALAAEKKKESVAEAARRVADDLRARARGPGRDLTKDEIDDLWGNG